MGKSVIQEKNKADYFPVTEYKTVKPKRFSADDYTPKPLLVTCPAKLAVKLLDEFPNST